MEQLCIVLWALLTGLGVYIPRGVSWLLDNWPPFAGWWNPKPAWAKMALLSVFTAVLGGAAAAIGVLVLHCSGWPEWMAIIYVILVAMAGYWNGGKRHEQQKRKEAEEEASRLRIALKYRE